MKNANDGQTTSGGQGTVALRPMVMALVMSAGWAVGQPTREDVARPGSPVVMPAVQNGNVVAQPVPVAPPPNPGGPGVPGAGPGANVDGAGAAPGGVHGGDKSIATDDPDMVTLSAFSEPVQLQSLVALVASTLNVNITIKGELPGTVVFNAPVPIKKAELLAFLDAMLEQQNYTINKDRFGFYIVHPSSEVAVNFGGDRPTTRIFSTPNIRPTSLKPAIESQLGGGGAAGQPAGGGRQVAYLDDLGVIVATDSPRRLEMLEDLIKQFRAEFAKAGFNRIELKYISAPVARDRVLQLVGQLSQSRSGIPGQENVPQPVPGQPGGGRSAGSLDNVGDRLTVDPQGNALIFTGVEEEIDRVKQLLAMIDQPNTLVPKVYYAGAAAKQMADLAKVQGLGEVTTIGLEPTDPNYQVQLNQRIQQATTGSTSTVGGPVMVVDDSRGQIIYYGTAEQQERLAQLIKEIDPQSEKIVIEAYKLKHSNAEDLAEVLQGLINNQTPVGSSPLLPDSTGLGQSGTTRRNSTSRNQRNPQTQAPQQGRTISPTNPAGSDEGLSLEGNAFVIADIANNQILVKAPKAMQGDFAKLINKLDIRRPQVYIEAKIVAVSWTDDMRLRFETQLINANGAGGLLQTNFGLSSPGGATTGAAGSITSPRVVSPGLSGFTAAVIKSEYVPIIINALQTETDARILSTPQLLVDDNEEASIISVDQQPTSTTTQSTGNPIQTGFGGYEQAGTELTVKPQISEGGYLRLKYEAKLSSFTGTATANLPPPKQENTIKSDSVTVPSDTTVVVGGLTFDSKTKTVGKVPLIGDIPLVGLLFQDRNTNNRKTTLYIFLTPRVLREPTFADLRLLTRGPRQVSGINDDVPALSPSVVEILMPSAGSPSGSEPVVPASTTKADPKEPSDPGESDPKQSVDPTPK